MFSSGSLSAQRPLHTHTHQHKQVNVCAADTPPINLLVRASAPSAHSFTVCEFFTVCIHSQCDISRLHTALVKSTCIWQVGRYQALLVTNKWMFTSADNSFSITGSLHSIRPKVLSYLGCLLEAVFGLHLQMKLLPSAN